MDLKEPFQAMNICIRTTYFFKIRFKDTTTKTLSFWLLFSCNVFLAWDLAGNYMFKIKNRNTEQRVKYV